MFVQHFSGESPPYTPNQPFPAGSDLDFSVTASHQSLFEWGFEFSLHNTYPILSDTIAVPSFLNTPSAGTPSDTFIANTSLPAEGDGILDHPLPRSFHNDYPIGHTATHIVNTNTSHSQLSLRERFDNVMKLVRQFPPGDKPNNTIFSPFFTKTDDNYICLLCPLLFPASAPKALSNRTQMIQHIAGGHGGSRPFACVYW